MTEIAHVLVPYHLDEYLPALDVPVSPEVTVLAELAAGDTWQRMAQLYAEVATRVASLARAGGRLVVTSGDCTTALGTVAGLQRAGLDPAVVWLDAHGDVQTLETTASGYLGGMALRILAGYRPELIATALGLRAVPEDRIVLVDARDLDPPEVEYLERSAIRRATVPRLDVDALPDGPLYLHVDADVVDPGDVPGLRYPAPGGPDLDTVAAALARVVATGRVAALGLACTWQQGQGGAARLGEPLAEALPGWI